jgi:RING finger family protein
MTVESRIAVERTAEGVRVTVPKTGLKKLGCLLVFAGFWTAMTLLAFLAALGAHFRVLRGHTSGEGMLSLIPFLLVGLGMGWIVLHMGLRSHVLERTRDTLTITRIGPFGTRRWSWPTPSIESIEAAESGWRQGAEGSETPIWELRVRLKGYRTRHFLRWRDDDELKRIARELHADFIASHGEPGITFTSTVQQVPAGECQVCGARMIDRIVHCAKCRTLHHEECWTYNGQCSTFGCREIRSVKGQPPA